MRVLYSCDKISLSQINLILSYLVDSCEASLHDGVPDGVVRPEEKRLAVDETLLEEQPWRAMSEQN